VEKVMDALDHVYGDAIRTLAKERTITEPFLERLAAIYTPSEFGLVQDIWVKDLAEGLKGLRAYTRRSEDDCAARGARGPQLCGRSSRPRLHRDS
jgi:hypothetical protein